MPIRRYRNTGLSNYEKWISLAVVMALVVLTTGILVGGQIFFWQRSVAQREREQYQAQIKQLQQQIVVLKENFKATPKPIPRKSLKTDTYYQKLLAGKEREVIQALQNRDMKRLAELTHPEKGVRFSPYAFVNVNEDRVLSATEIRTMAQDQRQYTWGYEDETGLAIRMTPAEYLTFYVYDRDYAVSTEKVGYNPTVSRTLTVCNLFEIYPEAVVAEFRFPQQNPREDTVDYRNLRLLFENLGDDWFLTGIVHDVWAL